MLRRMSREPRLLVGREILRLADDHGLAARQAIEATPAARTRSGRVRAGDADANRRLASRRRFTRLTDQAVETPVNVLGAEDRRANGVKTRRDVAGRRDGLRFFFAPTEPPGPSSRACAVAAPCRYLIEKTTFGSCCHGKAS